MSSALKLSLIYCNWNVELIHARKTRLIWLYGFPGACILTSLVTLTLTVHSLHLSRSLAVDLGHADLLMCLQPKEFFCCFILPWFEKELNKLPGRVVQSVGHLTRKSEVLGLIPGLATYFRFSSCWFKRGRSGGGVVDNTLDYQSRGRKMDPPLLRSFGWDFKPRSRLRMTSLLVGR